ncbi:MAG: 30S ribosomal protein S5 [Myxococcota bacterium]|nr:30S ribosomal protein S5 [Myxococcota bacterium]
MAKAKKKNVARKDENAAKVEKTIYINRVAKVVKGGRRFNFTAMVVAGDKEGKVGVGFGKANQVPEAIRKATERARAGLIDCPIQEGTIPHRVTGKYGATKIIFRPAAPGTGVIASSRVRAILDAAGYSNVLTKVIGSNNPHNVVKATLNALGKVESPAQYAARVGKSVDDVMKNYDVGSHVWKSSI